MKAAFFEARYNQKIDFPSSAINKLPKNIILLTTVQFLDSLERVKSQLEKNNKKVILQKGIHSKYSGQVLGCNLIQPIKETKSADCFLYLGDGLFHPKQLLLNNNIPVFVFNPINNKFFELNKKEIEKIKKRKKGALLKFYTSKKIGILVSIKSGQNNIILAGKLKKKLEKNKKQGFIFISDTIDLNEMENFPFIEMYVNTACPRISYDDYEKFSKPVMDLEDVPNEYQ